MDLALDIQLDAAGQPRLSSARAAESSRPPHSCRDCREFRALTGARPSKKDLKFVSEADLAATDIPLSEAEKQLSQLVRLEHNTVDLINENLKLKELVQFIGSTLAAELAETKKSEALLAKELAALKDRLAEAQRQLEAKTLAAEEAAIVLQRKKKELDDMLNTLAQREKTVEETSRYSDTLLAEKKRLLAIVEAKDRKHEALAQELFARDQLLAAFKEESDGRTRELQAEAAQLAERLRLADEQLRQAEKTKRELLAETAKLAEELRKKNNAGRPEDLAAALDQLKLLREECEALKVGLQMERNAGAAKAAELGRLKDQLAEATQTGRLLAEQVEADKAVVAQAGQSQRGENGKIKDMEARLAKTLSDLNTANKEIGDLRDKLSRQAREVEESSQRLQDSGRDADQLKAMLKQKQEELGAKSAEVSRISKEKDNEAVQKEKLAARIKSLEQEILGLKNRPASGGESSKLNEELADLRQKLKLVEEAKFATEAQRNRQLTDASMQLKARDEDIRVRAQTLKDNDMIIFKLQTDLRAAQEQLAKLRAELQEGGKAVKQRDRAADELREKLAVAEAGRVAAEEHAQESADQVTKLKKQAEELKKQIGSLQLASAAAQDSAEQLRRENAKQIEAILKEIVNVRKLEGEFLNECAKEYFSKMNAENDESRVKKTEESGWARLAIEFLREVAVDIDGQAEDIRQILAANASIESQIAKTLAKNQELETKVTDIQKSHDAKNDLIAQLIVKTMLLVAELERIG